MNDRELYFAALARAPHHGASSPEVAQLRAFTHAAMMAGRIDGATQDRIGQLLDVIEVREFAKVGDIIGHGEHVTDVPWNVLQVLDDEGTTWVRAFGADRFNPDDGPDAQEYDWTCTGGWSTTEGLLFYRPLQVMRVVRRPGDDD